MEEEIRCVIFCCPRISQKNSKFRQRENNYSKLYRELQTTGVRYNFVWIEYGKCDRRPFPRLGYKRILASVLVTSSQSLSCWLWGKPNSMLWAALWEGPHSKELICLWAARRTWGLLYGLICVHPQNSYIGVLHPSNSGCNHIWR